MRLIDADELIKRINEIYEGYMTDECGCVPYDFEKIVDEQPTVESKAYNQALEDMKKELIKIYHKRYMHDIYLDDIDDIVERLNR